MIVRTSVGGQRIRVQFSNAFGTTPITLGAAHIALRSKESAIAAGSDRALMFNGKPSAKIVPGAILVSDPVALNVPNAYLAVLIRFVLMQQGSGSKLSFPL